jgi:hypothetical protein
MGVLPPLVLTFANSVIHPPLDLMGKRLSKCNILMGEGWGDQTNVFTTNLICFVFLDIITLGKRSPEREERKE